jgi:hypothetical protein
MKRRRRQREREREREDGLSGTEELVEKGHHRPPGGQEFNETYSYNTLLLM